MACSSCVTDIRFRRILFRLGVKHSLAWDLLSKSNKWSAVSFSMPGKDPNLNHAKSTSLASGRLADCFRTLSRYSPCHGAGRAWQSDTLRANHAIGLGDWSMDPIARCGVGAWDIFPRVWSHRDSVEDCFDAMQLSRPFWGEVIAAASPPIA